MTEWQKERKREKYTFEKIFSITSHTHTHTHTLSLSLHLYLDIYLFIFIMFQENRVNGNMYSLNSPSRVKVDKRGPARLCNCKDIKKIQIKLEAESSYQIHPHLSIPPLDDLHWNYKRSQDSTMTPLAH